MTDQPDAVTAWIATQNTARRAVLNVAVAELRRVEAASAAARAVDTPAAAARLEIIERAYLDALDLAVSLGIPEHIVDYLTAPVGGMGDGQGSRPA